MQTKLPSCWLNCLIIILPSLTWAVPATVYGSAPARCPYRSAVEPPATYLPQTPDDILAKVNGFSIRRARVTSFVDRRLNRRSFSAEAKERLMETALDHLIDRQLIAEHLKSSPHWPGPNEIRLARRELEQRLEAIGQTFDQYLQRQNLTPEEWENETSWRIGWSRFLDATLTRPYLQTYFARHRRQFDGTRLRVAHIFWAVSGPDAIEPAIQHAKEVRELVQSGKLTWADAVRQESDAQTSIEVAGDIGWIEFAGPMPPAFTTAAFELDPGQLSRPVATRRGVHLIQCVELEPGNNDFGDVQDQVRAAATESLFRDLATQLQQQFGVVRTAQ